MNEEKLVMVRDWAKSKISAGQEPPWAWYQYMKLVETLDAILTGMAATTTVNSPQSDEHSETHLRLVDATDQRDSAPRRPTGLPVQPPM